MPTLYAKGDRELWVISPQDDSWSLPMYLEWRVNIEDKKEFAMLYPAVGLYVSQHVALQGILGAHDIQGRSDQWLIPAGMVAALMVKAPGVTPMRYYKWPDPACPVLPLANPMSLSPKGPEQRTENGSTDYEMFVAHVCHTNGLPNSIVRAVLRAVCDSAPRWMLEERRPLDLGFCRLVAAPFRANWKEIVSFKFQRYKILSLFSLPHKEKMKELDEIGIPEALCSPHNVGVKQSSGSSYKLEYTLEAIPSKTFESEVHKVEVKRQACGGTSYVASFEKTVESLYHHLLAALEVYLRKTRAPFARVAERGNSGLLRFLPTQGHKARVSGVGLRHLPVHIIPPDSPFSVFGEAGGSSRLRPQNPALHGVPNLPPGADDLRQRKWRPLATSGDQPTGANGVSMLGSGQIQTTEQQVFPGGEATERPASGMDGGGA